MSEDRNLYIEKLLSELKSLQESVIEIKNSDSMPFSFFRDSFSQTQEISSLLHKLEFMQVDDMKNQMEKLVFFLSESEKKGKVQERELERARDKERELAKDLEKESERAQKQEIELAKNDELVKEDNLVKEDYLQNRNVYADGLNLPEYKNPNTSIYHAQDNSKNNSIDNSVSKSVTPPLHIIDIKRGVSLNDRFLFQRELFNNSRDEMNSTLERLNRFDSYEDAEKYIRNNFTWDFENQTVNDFLLVVKKGFK